LVTSVYVDTISLCQT